eukprot:1526764-Rhodomonas_salina.1
MEGYLHYVDRKKKDFVPAYYAIVPLMNDKGTEKSAAAINSFLCLCSAQESQRERTVVFCSGNVNDCAESVARIDNQTRLAVKRMERSCVCLTRGLEQSGTGHGNFAYMLKAAEDLEKALMVPSLLFAPGLCIPSLLFASGYLFWRAMARGFTPVATAVYVHRQRALCPGCRAEREFGIRAETEMCFNWC